MQDHSFMIQPGSTALEPPGRFDLGHLLNCFATDAAPPTRTGEIGPHHAGLFECELGSNSLIWSGGMYDLFGLERHVAITREQILAHYSEESRAKMERLRAHAISRHVGFTLDIELRAAAVGPSRKVRLIASPVIEDGRAVRLHGVKLAL